MVVLAASTVFASEGWQTNYKAALAQAAKEGKPVLLDFTGSDWCPACKLIDQEIFSQAEFKKFAEKNLILVEVDSPMGKTQSAAIGEQNESLKAKYHVFGYPTLVLLDSRGKEITRNVGYISGGPKAFISWVEETVR